MFRHTDTPPPANRETESANRKIESLKNRQSTTTGQSDSQWKDILLPSQLSSQTFSLTVLTLPVRKTPAYQKGAKDRQMSPKPGGQIDRDTPSCWTNTPQPLVEQRFPPTSHNPFAALAALPPSHHHRYAGLADPQCCLCSPGCQFPVTVDIQ